MSNSSIAKSARIGDNTTVGDFCHIGEDVTIGSGCEIGHGVVVRTGTVIGDRVRIDDHASIGKLPMKAANSAVTKDSELPPAQIGKDSIIGTQAVIYRGALLGQKIMVADLATIRENVSVGDFTIVGRGVTIENLCKIGRYVKLETNSYITAYSELEDRVFIAPCAATSNDNFVGRTEKRFENFKGAIIKKGARVGVNATILPGKVLGEDCLVAAGALVVSDVPAGKIVAGVPAKVFRDVPEDQLLKNQGWKE